MAQYGEVAKLAARLLKERTFTNPDEAWREAAGSLLRTPSSRARACPRTTFLGLCGDGAVEGVRPGSYTRATRSPRYARRALLALRSRPQLAEDPRKLWEIATEGTGLRASGQMDVLTGLWSGGFLR